MNHSVVMDNLGWDRRTSIHKWLEDTYGPSTKNTWDIDYDYDMTTLLMIDEIYSMYLLRWEHE